MCNTKAAIKQFHVSYEFFLIWFQTKKTSLNEDFAKTTYVFMDWGEANSGDILTSARLLTLFPLRAHR